MLPAGQVHRDYLCWYDVAIGEKTKHPDFIVFHPNRGLLVLEVKDWRLDLGDVLPPHLVICQDEMYETVDTGK
ncbi:hypothetical protein CBM2609_A170098 [Cupriavidus taiwanensis]|uniref:nuclease-related domain-containing protein n=1 Tax=Cupriavidus taiwanensis TaxID=164546 RepID=UPI000E156ED9|nr:nuclease-related domain-containing protein [Cupriavidus taiwanensis]SOZ14434.1 hypothetical protein CBM2604_A140098 [Cupriavidus taiwanensis]SOZ25833.1 hypothetical protein CBM2609_A170098 [Cupriavidus taiwanensis]SOZ45043.1 hypothetical protein CBM2610_A160096 [Cupriavidus taiwanensis]